MIPKKNELRKHFLSLRAQIPNHRREEAKKILAETFGHQGKILSFYSVGSEIDTSLLNEKLIEKGDLFYPRLEGDVFTVYQYEKNHPLIFSSLGIPEPDPATARKTTPFEMDWILVPALVFDQEKYRLGYGKGVYDRFLSTTKDIPTMGIGFKEQLSIPPLPRDAWDLPVQEVILF